MGSTIQTISVVSSATEAVEGVEVELSQWYWVKDDDDEDEWLGCVTHLGSNYVEMSSATGGDTRIHADEFWAKCRREPNAAQVVQQKADEHRLRVKSLMGEVEALTARLGVGHTAVLSPGSEGQALARLDPKQDVGEYKSALIKAKEEDLPTLFKKIEKASEGLALWMKAETLPMRAQFEQMKESIDHIDTRIFNVELYAGLSEIVVQITDGEPAEMTEKIRLMQRRCYMDEECLAQYEVGGMEFDDIQDFDAWLARPANLDRLLPFPRCVVAFRVRRNDKLREIHSLIDLFDADARSRKDKTTFLYIRNGGKLYRMNTKLEFGAEMFPDTDHHQLTSGAKLWAKVWGSNGRVEKIITDAQYQGEIEDYAAKVAEYRIEKAQHKVDLRAWEAQRLAAKEAGEDFNEREYRKPYLFGFSGRSPEGEYEPFEPGNIYYDDIQKELGAEIQKFNRIGIILQGLLDRSPVLHPHPPWKIWSEGGFAQAVELVYDASRALVGGEKPDFEAYRKRLNASLKPGSVTVGQRTVWDAKVREDRADRYGGKRSTYGNPGPGRLAKVVGVKTRKGEVTYAWYREGQSRGNYGKQYRTTFSCDADQVLNVDAYTPNDFRQFFADPRTRAEYVQWAWLLLEAEEYHAGNREVEEPPEPEPKQESSRSSQEAYRRRKECEALLGKRVRLRRMITTTRDEGYAAGTLWDVIHSSGGSLTIRTKIDGKTKSVSGLQLQDLEVVDD